MCCERFLQWRSADNDVSELFDFSEKLAEMRLAAEMKGGKTYLDLRKCIEKAVEAHKQYLQVSVTFKGFGA